MESHVELLSLYQLLSLFGVQKNPVMEPYERMWFPDEGGQVPGVRKSGSHILAVKESLLLAPDETLTLPINAIPYL